jgi:anti-sigma factor RsiW
MNCRDATDFLSDYISGELNAASAATFEQHLLACPNCREFLIEYRGTIRLTREACREGDAAEAALPEDLVKAIIASLADTK